MLAAGAGAGDLALDFGLGDLEWDGLGDLPKAGVPTKRTTHSAARTFIA